MTPRSLEERKKELDAKLIRLVDGFRRWGVKAVGTYPAGRVPQDVRFPSLETPLTELPTVAKILNKWNSGIEPRTRWVIRPIFDKLWLLPQGWTTIPMEKLFDAAEKFGDWLLGLPEDFDWKLEE